MKTRKTFKDYQEYLHYLNNATSKEVADLYECIDVDQETEIAYSIQELQIKLANRFTEKDESPFGACYELADLIIGSQLNGTISNIDEDKAVYIVDYQTYSFYSYDYYTDFVDNELRPEYVFEENFWNLDYKYIE